MIANLRVKKKYTDYLGFSVLLLVLMVITLLPHYYEIHDPDTEVSLGLIWHGVLYLGWYVLFVLQSWLITRRNISLHKRLGYASIGLFALLVLSGGDMLLNVIRGYDPSWEIGQLIAKTSFALAIIHTLLFFMGFYWLAYLNRRRPDIHKRLMVMASISMIAASITRIAYLPFIPIDGTLLTLLVTYGFLIAPMVIDKIRHKRIHKVYWVSIPFYAITQMLCMGGLSTLPFIQDVIFLQ